MLALFAALLIGSAVLNLPAWIFARSRNEATWWLPFIGAPPIVAWAALAALGVGPQSLSNIVEALALAALSVLLCYSEAFLLNRWFRDSRQTSTFLLVADSDGFRTAVPSEVEHPFREMANTHSDGSRTLIPSEAEHP